MGIFKRAAEIVEAKVSGLLERMEDPNEMLDLSYEKMISNLQEVKGHLADVVTEQKSLEAQMDKSKGKMNEYEESARAALKVEREDLAKEALLRKQQEAKHWEQLQEGRDQIAQQAEKLKAAERNYRERINAFRSKKEISKATYQAAEARVKVSESLTGMSHDLGGVGETIRRAEDKTDDMAARAAAMDSLTEDGFLEDSLDKEDAITRELDKLSQDSAVESDLARLKKELRE